MVAPYCFAAYCRHFLAVRIHAGLSLLVSLGEARCKSTAPHWHCSWASLYHLEMPKNSASEELWTCIVLLRVIRVLKSLYILLDLFSPLDVNAWIATDRAHYCTAARHCCFTAGLHVVALKLCHRERTSGFLASRECHGATDANKKSCKTSKRLLAWLALAITSMSMIAMKKQTARLRRAHRNLLL